MKEHCVIRNDDTSIVKIPSLKFRRLYISHHNNSQLLSIKFHMRAHSHVKHGLFQCHSLLFHFMVWYTGNGSYVVILVSWTWTKSLLIGSSFPSTIFPVPDVPHSSPLGPPPWINAPSWNRCCCLILILGSLSSSVARTVLLYSLQIVLFESQRLHGRLSALHDYPGRPPLPGQDPDVLCWEVPQCTTSRQK